MIYFSEMENLRYMMMDTKDRRCEIAYAVTREVWNDQVKNSSV